MSTGKYLSIVNGLPVLYDAVNLTTGSGDANKLVKTGSNGKIDNSFINSSGSVVPSQGVSVTASKFLILSDANTYQNCTNTASISLTVTNDLITNFPLWTEIEIARNDIGTVYVDADSGVVIRRLGSTTTTNHGVLAQYGAVIIKKIAANTWVIYGDIE